MDHLAPGLAGFEWAVRPIGMVEMDVRDGRGNRQAAVASRPVRTTEPGIAQAHISAEYDDDQRECRQKKRKGADHRCSADHLIFDARSRRFKSLLMSAG